MKARHAQQNTYSASREELMLAAAAAVAAHNTSMHRQPQKPQIPVAPLAVFMLDANPPGVLTVQ
jgi:hypothetical protein